MNPAPHVITTCLDYSGNGASVRGFYVIPPLSSRNMKIVVKIREKWGMERSKIPICPTA